MTDVLSGVKYAGSILETIGHTPLVKLSRVSAGIKAPILAKVEFMNPGGSVKDRIGVTMIDDAERKGLLKPGGTIVESTSGNTGAGLALVAAVRGYRAVFTMPDKMSKEKIRLLKAYGAEVITCPTAVPAESEESYYSVAKRIVEDTPNSILANQYHNPLNPLAHYQATGPEIWDDTAGKVDYFVCGIGTGGTISGIGRYLKEKKPSVKIIGVDVEGSILREFFYTRHIGEAKPYLVEGIGEDIIPTTFEYQYVDDIITVGDRASFNMARRLSREEGLMVGGSCGTAVVGALEVARKLEKDQLVVVLLPDTGERYLSKFHSDEWMRENRMFELSSLTVRDLLRVKEPGLPAIIHVETTDSIQTALARMEEYHISQVPVRRGDAWVGKLLEGDVLDLLLSQKVSAQQPVESVMTEAFPVVRADADRAEVLKAFSSRSPAVLVEDETGPIGILTKVDVVEYMLASM